MCAIGMQGLASAELWQLRWRVPAGSTGLDAASMAARVHINPCMAGAPTPPPPLAPPVAVSLTIQHATAALLLRSPAQAAGMEELLTLCLHPLQVCALPSAIRRQWTLRTTSYSNGLPAPVLAVMALLILD